MEDQTSGMDPKTLGIIAYLTLIGTIIALVINNSNKKNEHASFHIRQALGLGLTGIVVGFVNIIPILGQIAWILGAIVLFIMWIIGILGAINGEQKLVPLLGDKYQEWLKGI